MKFIRYEINIWNIEETADTKLAGITKMGCIELEDMHFNDFVNDKLGIIKKLIDEI